MSFVFQGKYRGMGLFEASLYMDVSTWTLRLVDPLRTREAPVPDFVRNYVTGLPGSQPRGQWQPLGSAIDNMLKPFVPSLTGYDTLAPGLLQMRVTGQAANASFGPAGTGLKARIDLTNADLSGIVFTNCDFRGARLDGASFQGSTFRQCSFDRDSLKGHNLLATDFVNQTLDGLDLSQSAFSWARLNGCVFRNCVAAGTKFNHAFLADSKWPGALLKNADFTSADLARADFSGLTLGPGSASLAAAKLGRAEGARTMFLKATVDMSVVGDFSGLDCTDATLTGLPDAPFTITSAVLDGVVFSGQTFTAQFVGCFLRGASFSNCDLEDSTFTGGCVLCGSTDGTRSAVDFGGANLRNVNFDSADLTGVSFAAADLWGAKFTRATMVFTSFANAFVPEADFAAIKDKQMAGVDFTNAFIVSASFRETTMLTRDGKAPNFTGACMLGTDFTGGSLSDAILTNAKLAAASGTIDATPSPRTAGEPPSTISFDYEPTKLPSSITGPSTRCPAGGSGPCTPRQLTTPVPAVWVQPS